ncbi:hypothetical protein CEUSTIGMA_g354.t1 [Chlamydomonas eustigma]|uniref:Uncharacterized protein n=1 Tax=Chlamydomonas eustigma TaxID=1157962 RepID=A0A250WQC9_9CHLO|nr:hypothetical protein CEUSTIGMA_g354.t1 [Chlamydomonas eustigma]|eukprot:GAX72899.1 hypothetical protein CEUSTIGMA_g354.t1 [Chlamydomonas eustigma]
MKKSNAQFKTCLGPSSKLPNVYWQAISTQQLRHYHSFIALPPATDVTIRGPESYRYVRQEDVLWSSLHAGVLTTGKLSQALGLREPHVAQRISAPKVVNSVKEAYVHLLQPPWFNPNYTETSGKEGDACEFNERLRIRYNSELIAQHDQLSKEGESESDKRRVSELLGLRGTTAIRLTWGTIQEPSSLHILMQMFPSATLEEVGMFNVKASDLPTQNLGFGSSELPSLGASPDAVISHRLPIFATDLQEGREMIDHMMSGGFRSPLMSYTSTSVEAGPEAGVTTSHHSLGAWLGSQVVGNMTFSEGSQVGSTAWCVAEAVLKRALSRVTSKGIETSDLMGSNSQGGADSVVLNRVEAAQGTTTRVQAKIVSLQTTWSESVSHLATKLLASRDNLVELRRAATHDSQNMAALDPVLWMDVREVVEVKNHSPFAFKGQRKAKKGRLHLEYRIADPGPMQSLRPIWMPQLQMHCLASGAASVLLLTRSATKGVRLFRVYRDTPYIQLMLTCLREFQTRAVLQKVEPTTDFYQNCHWYPEIIERTVQLAQEAQLVAQVDSRSVKLPVHADDNAFWNLNR